jgi:hypothetical protein
LVDLYETKARKSLTELDEGSPVIGRVKELTPAGYSVEIDYEGVTLSGFMPNTLAGINKLSNPESIVGETFEVMIETFSREEGTYIVSRKKYLQSLIPEAIKQLEFGKVYEGFVTGTTDYGAFVEFNDCLTGMIHKSNINPEFADAFGKESETRAVPLNQAWDEVDYMDLEIDQDWLEKAQAIVSGEIYDTRVQVPLDFSDEELLKYMKLAHEQDVTFNQLVTQALTEAIAQHKTFMSLKAT